MANFIIGQIYGDFCTFLLGGLKSSILGGLKSKDYLGQKQLVEDKKNYMEHLIPAAPVAAPGQQVLPQALAEGSKEIAEQELLQIVRESHACKQEEGQSVSSYVLKMKSYIDNSERLGQPVSLRLAMLPKKYVAATLHVIRAKRVKKNQKKKPHKAAKGNQRKGKQKMGYAPVSVQSFAPKPKNPPPPKKENPTKDAICHHCGEVGHWRRNCPVYLAELLKNKKLYQGASTSGIFTIELYSFPSTSWVYDTGCGNHICITTQGLRGSRKLKPGALSLYEVENQLGKTIKSLRSDRGGEYMSQEFLDHLKEHGIISHRTPPYTLQHNGVSERRNITLLDMVDKTPYKVWHGQAPKLSYLKVWGCEALVKHDTLTKPDKLELISIKCIFVGYLKETMRYSFYYPPENKVFVAHNAELFENSLITQEASESLEDLEIIQKEDTHLSIDTYIMMMMMIKKLMNLKVISIPFMQSMKDNEFWDLVDLLSNDKTIGSKWLFKKKTSMDGAVHTYKARLVAKGFTQTYGFDYEETFSLVEDIRATRILIAITAFYDYEIWQMNVKIAFRNGHLSEKVYMVQPEGFVNPKYPNRLCKLKRSIYGLKSYVTFLILYVDAIFIMGNNIPMLQDVKSYLGRCFAMKDLGEAVYILGIKIYRDRSKRLIGLCQSAYIEKILKRYFMENSKRGAIPICTRHDVAFAQNITSRFQQNPGKLYWTTVKNILKYLRNSKDMFLVYGGNMKREIRVSCYTDAGYLMDADDPKSQTGYVFVLNGGAVDWKSTKQSIFATSSTEVGYIAAYDASKEAVWIQKFIYGLGIVSTIEEPIKMYCDNTGAIATTK
nr:hypothetical protein [Tanacetum cinerariifolium]